MNAPTRSARRGGAVAGGVARALAGTLVLLALAACTGSERHAATSEKVVHLWVAPNEEEERFWTIAVARWNARKLGARVEFTTIPATGGSEEAILTALVSGSGPDISSNIFPGFAAQLANLGQLQDLAAMPRFEAIVDQRQMRPMLRDSMIGGHQYLIPLYYSPALVWWRADILAELGVKRVPATFEDVIALSRLRARHDGGLGMQVLAGREWRSRWFDYIAYFYAGSAGAPYIAERRAQYASAASIDALEFIRTMFDSGWTGLDFDADDPLPRGLVAGAVHGAWDLKAYSKNHPDTLKQVVIGPMLRSAAALRRDGGKAHTFADCKGMVVFKSSKVQAEALAFMAWVLSDDEISLLWFQETGNPPARGDLMTNPIFAGLYRDNPRMAQYASYVDVAVPTAPLEQTIDVNKIMGVQMVEAVHFGATPVRQAAAEAARRTDALLERTR